MATSKQKNKTFPIHLFLGKMLAVCIGLFCGLCHSQTLTDKNKSIYVSEGTVMFLAGQDQTTQTKEKKQTPKRRKNVIHLVQQEKKVKKEQSAAYLTKRQSDLLYRPYKNEKLSIAERSIRSGILVQNNEKTKLFAEAKITSLTLQLLPEDRSKTQFSIYRRSLLQKEVFTTRHCRPPPFSRVRSIFIPLAVGQCSLTQLQI